MASKNGNCLITQKVSITHRFSKQEMCFKADLELLRVICNQFYLTRSCLTAGRFATRFFDADMTCEQPDHLLDPIAEGFSETDASPTYFLGKPDF